jgi:uncharacterized protein YkwD
MFRRLMAACPLVLVGYVLVGCALAGCALTTGAAAMDLKAVDLKAMDLNSFRASHKRPPLQFHAGLAAAADAHARDLAARNRLDHAGFRQRLDAVSSGAAAENVSYGCEDEACAIRQWSRSSGHRANMLRRDVTGYGLASARAESGRRYWVLELGN